MRSVGSRIAGIVYKTNSQLIKVNKSFNLSQLGWGGSFIQIVESVYSSMSWQKNLYSENLSVKRISISVSLSHSLVKPLCVYLPFILAVQKLFHLPNASWISHLNYLFTCHGWEGRANLPNDLFGKRELISCCCYLLLFFFFWN